MTPRFNWFVSLIALSLLTTACAGPQSPTTSTADPGVVAGQVRSPVKKLIVVILQNHSFDSIFATFPGVQNPLTSASPGYVQPGASGGSVSPYLLTDPFPADLPHSYSYYPEDVNGGKMDGFAATENTNVSMGHYDDTIAGVDTLWKYASQYALADNFFAPSLSTQPNLGLLMISAADTGNPNGLQPAYGPCNKPNGAAPPLTNKNVGDEMNDAGVSWGWFHEEYGVCNDYTPTENPFQYFTSTQNSANIQDITNFTTQLANNSLPTVSFLTPGGAHNCHPGNDSITACASYLDNLVQSIQSSPAWPDCAIIVYWDESGGFYDHVPPPTVGGVPDGIRIPMMVISPFAKTGYISHVQMDNISILRFIQWNWGLPSLNARNAAPGSTVELRDMFTF